jgi:transglutaminase 1
MQQDAKTQLRPYSLVSLLNRSIPSGSEATATFKMTPKFSGRGTIAAKFVSKELEDVDGFLNFMVEPKKEVVNGTGNAA